MAATVSFSLAHSLLTPPACAWASAARTALEQRLYPTRFSGRRRWTVSGKDRQADEEIQEPGVRYNVSPGEGCKLAICCVAVPSLVATRRHRDDNRYPGFSRTC